MTRMVAAPLTLAFCVAGGPLAQTADQPRFVPDVSEDEWKAAVSLEGAKALVPKQLKGPKNADIPQLPPGKYYAAVEFLIRADGTTGVYRIVETNNQSLALAVVKMIRKQRFTVPMRDGVPVAIHGERRFDVAVERSTERVVW